MKHAFKILIKKDLFIPGTIRLIDLFLFELLADSFLILPDYVLHSLCEVGSPLGNCINLFRLFNISKHNFIGCPLVTLKKLMKFHKVSKL